MLPATHSLQFRVHTRVLVTLLLVLTVLTVAVLGEPAHRKLLTEATAAQKAGDHAGFVAKLEAARAARPDYPRVLLHLSRGYAALDRSAEAIAQLESLADMGLAFNVAADPALASLRTTPDFARVVARFEANSRPRTRSVDEAAWAVPDATGILESIAIHPATLESFFGDVRNRCIWYRDVSGAHAVLRRFSAESDALDAVFAVKIDAARDTLWATTSALAEMVGYDESQAGRGALVAYDLRTRRLRAKYPLPTDGARHVLGDCAIGADGSVYVTDSASPVVWRLAAEADRLEPWLRHEDFVSLQGVAMAEDGQTLFLSDYANGIWRVDGANRAASLLRPPARTTLFGIDGLYAVEGGLIAVQNGVNPQRILRIDLDASGQPTAARVVFAGHAAMTDAALGQVIKGRLHFVANAGWSLFEPPGPAPAPRTVTILSAPTE